MIHAAFIGTFIPMLFLLIFLRHSRPVFSVFCWGMVSFVAAYYLNGALVRLTAVPPDFRIVAILVAPPVEELLKMLPLFYFLLFARRSFLPFIYIFGMAAGIGFAIEENLLYLIEHSGAIASAPLYMVVRSMSTCLMHGISTAVVGLSFTYIRRHGGVYYAFIPVSYLAAVALHAGYNFLVISRLSALGLLAVLAAYFTGAVIMRHLAERMPEAKDVSWQNR